MPSTSAIGLVPAAGVKRLAWVAAAAAAAVTAWASLSRPVDERLSDLHVYVGAVTAPSLYDFVRGDAPFTYPPVAALLLRPLADVPVPLLQTLWTLATVASVTVMAFLAARAYAGHATSGRAGWVALALASSAPFSSNLRFGQVSAFLTVLILVDLLVLRRTRYGGVLIGLAATVKLTPLIFIALLFLAGRRRAAVTAAAAFAVGTAIGAVARPGDSRRFWTSEIFDVARLGNITSAGNQSLNGALLRFHLPAEPRSLLVMALGGTIAAAALWRAARAARTGDWLTAAIITGAASIVLSPVSWTHHQFWLVLGILLPVRGHRTRVGWIVLVIVCMILPVTALGGPLWTNSRLLLAIGIAAVLRIRPVEPPPVTCGRRLFRSGYRSRMPETTTELGDFLRRRRESLPPASVGIKSVTLRRTPGLRRSEVAERANMSLVYYERLEQGRGPHPSASMLGNIAQALELNADERDHLFRLAGYSTPFDPESRAEPDPQLTAALEALSPHVPAAIVDELGDVLVQNPMNVALFGDLTRPSPRSTNLIWQWFTCPEYRHFQEPPEQHEQTGQAFVADLRAVVARRGRDPRAVVMVDELRSASKEFADWWDDHTVSALHCNLKRIDDARVGLLELECSVMLSQSSTQRLMLLPPRPGTDTGVRLARLLQALKV